MKVDQFVDEVILNPSVYSANVILEIPLSNGKQEQTFRVDASFGADEADPRTGIRMERVMFGFGDENIMMHSTYYVYQNKSYRGDYVSGITKVCESLVSTSLKTRNKNVMTYYRDETNKILGTFEGNQ